MEDMISLSEFAGLLFGKWRKILIFAVIGLFAGCLFSFYQFLSPSFIDEFDEYTAFEIGSIQYSNEDSSSFEVLVSNSQVRSVFISSKVSREVLSSCGLSWEIISNALKLNPDALMEQQTAELLGKMSISISDTAHLFTVKLVGTDSEVAQKICHLWMEVGMQMVHQTLPAIEISSYDSFVTSKSAPPPSTFSISSMIKKSILFSGAALVLVLCSYSLFYLLTDRVKGSFTLTRRYSIDLFGCIASNSESTISYAEIFSALSYKSVSLEQPLILFVSISAPKMKNVCEVLLQVAKQSDLMVSAVQVGMDNDLIKPPVLPENMDDMTFVDAMSLNDLLPVMDLLHNKPLVVFCIQRDKTCLSTLDIWINKVDINGGIPAGFILHN